ncbi:MAG: hypothetical protein ABIR96_05020 [Bdellovibrionota bacterium]
MELSCPSCSSKHRTEDYPGAFEIQCACGYSILVPDEKSLTAPLDESDLLPLPDFDGAPMAQEHQNENLISIADTNSSIDLDVSIMAAQAQDDSPAFSSLNLTAPEDLPDGMPYDPFELENQWKPEEPVAEMAAPLPSPNKARTATPAATTPKPSPAKPIEAQDLVNRIQMASIGYMHGALFDLNLGEFPDSQLKKLSERCVAVLDDKPWLRAYVSKGFEKPEELLKNRKLSAVPELLAVEIYLHCAQNQIACELLAHKT